MSESLLLAGSEDKKIPAAFPFSVTSSLSLLRYGVYS
jgi:hypothetical protein